MDHTIPAVARAVDVMDHLSRAGSASIAELTAALAIPRSTVYRVLNTLESSSMVVRGADGTYGLGPRLLRLARAVAIGADIVAIARPVLERLCAGLDMSAKLTVLQDGQALVVAVAESRQAYTVSTQVGRRFPLHAGAASKLLLAHMAPAEAATVLAGPLPAFTPSTIVRPQDLERELEAIRTQGWSEDRSEFVAGVNAFAAPVTDAEGAHVAAVSVPYLAATPADLVTMVRSMVLAAASDLSVALGGR